MDSARRLTGIAGRWSATHPWTVIAAWVGCAVVLLLTGHLVGTVQLPNSQTASGQAGQAEQMMSRDFAERANEFVLFDSRSLQVGAPAYEAAIRDVLNRIQATGRVTQIHSPLDPSYANQISANRHGAVVAALLPLGLAVMAILAATGLVAFTSHLSGRRCKPVR
jgi:uncharacterized membrane protein YdfJ with MMPL/SSD domain